MFIVERVPPRNEIIPVFASIVFPLYSWTIYWMLDYLPSWLKSMTLGETIPVNAYAFVLVLFESIFLLVLILLLSIILPKKWLRVGFVPKGSILAWLICLFSYFAQLNNINRVELISELLLWTIFVISVVIFFALITKSIIISTAISSLSDKLSVFLYIYLPISLISLIIVVVNNLV